MAKDLELKYGLKTHTIEVIQSVFNKHPHIAKAILYGSRAKGNYRPSSDIDMTLQGEGLDYSELLRIENELDDLLLPYQIDLSLYSHINNPDLIDHIRRVGVDFYTSEVGV